MLTNTATLPAAGSDTNNVMATTTGIQIILLYFCIRQAPYLKGNSSLAALDPISDIVD